ncbi:hypothetical protein [Cupriavidus campinensis]
MQVLTHEENRNGMKVRLEVFEDSMRAQAIRGGKVIATAVAGHGGAIGPSSYRPHTSNLAKSLMAEAVDKALGRTQRSAFDRLVDEMHAARQRAGGGLRKALGNARAVFFKARG